ncbi:MAG: hypothetical protein M0Z61_14480 [Nitrospiraceae bacterium]|nr:hypothetical protein [Nitrospiraceae bacterium]
MRRLIFGVICIFGFSLFASGAALARTETGNAPISQNLVREGDFAVKLASALKLGNTTDEAQAESALTDAGIGPKNGWIADYPITPDITGELQASISTAADSGKISMGRDDAISAFENVLSAYNLPVKAGGAQEETGQPSGESYPDTTVINNYYYEEGPPVVTYYAPPPDYAYLYTWVPYPFWWTNFWYPGFFVLGDFDIDEFDGFHHHRYITNHFREPDTGRIVRIDPTNRARGRFVTGRVTRTFGPSARRGAQSILQRNITGRTTSVPGRQFRGFGVTRPSTGTRSNAFQRWGNSRFEGAASTRGFRSRSSAGQLPSRSFTPGIAPSRSFAPGRAPSGGFEGFHGSGGFSPGGGGRIPSGGGGGAPRGGGGGFRR